jgi:hypothetical protein
VPQNGGGKAVTALTVRRRAVLRPGVTNAGDVRVLAARVALATRFSSRRGRCSFSLAFSFKAVLALALGEAGSNGCS